MDADKYVLRLSGHPNRSRDRISPPLTENVSRKHRKSPEWKWKRAPFSISHLYANCYSSASAGVISSGFLKTKGRGLVQKEARPTILIVVLGILVVFALGYLLYQSDQMEMPESYATATAVLSSPTGKTVGKITFQQSENGVLIKAEAHSLSPGGHALSIHPVGSCSPDIRTAGRQINSTGDEQGLVATRLRTTPRATTCRTSTPGRTVSREPTFSAAVLRWSRMQRVPYSTLMARRLLSTKGRTLRRAEPIWEAGWPAG